MVVDPASGCPAFQPGLGLTAAITLVRVLSVVIMPALGHVGTL